MRESYRAASMGAKWSVFFFALKRSSFLPDADALWLPGGYQGLHAKALSGQHRHAPKPFMRFLSNGAKGILA